jgi:hypothetical protein
VLPEIVDWCVVQTWSASARHALSVRLVCAHDALALFEQSLKRCQVWLQQQERTTTQQQQQQPAHTHGSGKQHVAAALHDAGHASSDKRGSLHAPKPVGQAAKRKNLGVVRSKDAGFVSLSAMHAALLMASGIKHGSLSAGNSPAKVVGSVASDMRASLPKSSVNRSNSLPADAATRPADDLTIRATAEMHADDARAHAQVGMHGSCARPACSHNPEDDHAGSGGDDSEHDAGGHSSADVLAATLWPAFDQLLCEVGKLGYLLFGDGWSEDQAHATHEGHHDAMRHGRATSCSIGLRITECPPHRVVEMMPGGPAHKVLMPQHIEFQSTCATC